MQRFFKCTSLFVLVSVVATELHAQQVSVSSTPTENQEGTETTVTVTVKAIGDEEIKDFHLRKPRKGVTPKAGTISVTGGGGSTWSEGDLNSGGADITTSGAGLSSGHTGQDTLTFTITYTHSSDSNLDFEEIRWYATDDGGELTTKGPNANVVQEGGPTTGGGMVLVPVNSLSARDQSGGIVVTPGVEFPFVLETNLRDQVFQLHTATALSTTDGGADDPLGIGLDTTAEIPPEWGVELHPASGMFRVDADGERRAAPTLSIPDDPDLVGRVFYVVGSIDSDGDGRPDVFTRILRVTVQPTGSTQGGLEFLDAVQD